VSTNDGVQPEVNDYTVNRGLSGDSPASDRSTSKISGKKADSSSTWNNGYYKHNNISASSLGKKKKGSADKLLQIGSPTGFEHGLHVEYHHESGVFLVRIDTIYKCLRLCVEGSDSTWSIMNCRAWLH